ncbi:MAG TPA: tRNA (adenosine(37)-N6)-threonylcarbamoyltransferase complex dimerization subunit type 1 TsaB [Candidatus Baltobacterales bacterium]|nr:tRNA (adenosine(37)-N6)-threonylcarbamoyltransferase complex dimerization subunit type 1 TsaB [Candidatus Baltobacterales bacterium]
MISVIDTSSARSAIALIDESGKVVREELHDSGRSFDLPARHRALVAGMTISKVAVATGPGSFTGLRVGVSFGLGIAIGLGVPIVPLPSLAIQAARSEQDVVALAEAGRGRVYFMRPGGEAALAEPHELDTDLPFAGWLREATRQSLVAAGLRAVPEGELRSFGEAAATIVAKAREVAYGSLKLEYRQSFTSRV